MIEQTLSTISQQVNFDFELISIALHGSPASYMVILLYSMHSACRHIMPPQQTRRVHRSSAFLARARIIAIGTGTNTVVRRSSTALATIRGVGLGGDECQELFGIHFDVRILAFVVLGVHELVELGRVGQPVGVDVEARLRLGLLQRILDLTRTHPAIIAATTRPQHTDEHWARATVVLGRNTLHTQYKASLCSTEENVGDGRHLRYYTEVNYFSVCYVYT